MRVAVVGSGITGLASALLLSRRGHQVTLLEAQGVLGGVARSMEFAGHSFCPGPQYLWGFEPQGPATRILGSVDIALPTREVSADFELLAVGDGCFASLHDHGVQAANAPHALAAERLAERLDRLGRAGEAIAVGARFRANGVAMMHAVATSPRLGLGERAEVVRCRSASVADLARRCGVPSSRLRSIACSQGIFAERLDDLSAIVFAAARHHLVRSLHVPQGGIVTLLNTLIAAVTDDSAITTLLHTKLQQVERRTRGQRLHTNGRAIDVDHIVFCCSPGVVASFHEPLRKRFEPANGVGAVCLGIDISEADAALIKDKNFTWYAGEHDDVDFNEPGPGVDTLNFISPTLAGGAPGRHQVVCAFFPIGRFEDGNERALKARDLVEHLLARRVGHPVRATEMEFIGPRQWTEQFGAFEGAVYGRRLTSSSLRRSLTDGLPAGWSLAHSGAGVPGVLGCLQMAEAVAHELPQ